MHSCGVLYDLHPSCRTLPAYNRPVRYPNVCRSWLLVGPLDTVLSRKKRAWVRADCSEPTVEHFCGSTTAHTHPISRRLLLLGVSLGLNAIFSQTSLAQDGILLEKVGIAPRDEQDHSLTSAKHTGVGVESGSETHTIEVEDHLVSCTCLATRVRFPRQPFM